MTEDSWEEAHEIEMGTGGICDRRYGYMTATDCLHNLYVTTEEQLFELTLRSIVA